MNTRMNVRKRMAALPFIAGVLVCVGVVKYISDIMLNSDEINLHNTIFESSNRLLVSEEVCPTQMCGEHCLFEHETGAAGLCISIGVIIYCFFGLAIICDEFFVASLEKISEGLKLSEDVAGATFMAAGSSAPELFVSMADNVFSKPQSVGVGTIIGSAIFNILIIIALTAILSGQTLLLDWRPLLRDSTWYCISILILVFSVADNYIQWYESLIMLIGYVSYISYMSLNSKIVARFCTKKKASVIDSTTLANIEDAMKETTTESHTKKEGEEDGGVELAEVKIDTNEETAAPPDHSGVNPKFKSEFRTSKSAALFRKSVNRIILQQRVVGSMRDLVQESKEGETTTTREGTDEPKDVDVVATTTAEDDDNEEGYFDALKPPTKVGDNGKEFSSPMLVLVWSWYLVTLPLMIAMKCTVPDCRFKIFDNTPGIIGSFVMSIVWIALLSHFLVEYATIFGCLVGISAPLMGLTLIAAGTSVPDAMSSVIVARQGEGDMAVSNAIGSNVFDILMGIGLPYLIASTIAHPDLVDNNGVPAIFVQTGDLAVSIGILFGVVVAVIVMLLLTKWRLYPFTGYILIAFYVLFVIFSLFTGFGQ